MVESPSHWTIQLKVLLNLVPRESQRKLVLLTGGALQGSAWTTAGTPGCFAGSVLQHPYVC